MFKEILTILHLNPGMPVSISAPEFRLTCTCGSSGSARPAGPGPTGTEGGTEEVGSLTTAPGAGTPAGPGRDKPTLELLQIPVQVLHTNSINTPEHGHVNVTAAMHLHRSHTIQAFIQKQEHLHLLTCSSAFTLSSSQPTSSSTSSVLRPRNSSDRETSTKCWWR